MWNSRLLSLVFFLFVTVRYRVDRWINQLFPIIASESLQALVIVIAGLLLDPRFHLAKLSVELTYFFRAWRNEALQNLIFVIEDSVSHARRRGREMPARSCAARSNEYSQRLQPLAVEGNHSSDLHVLDEGAFTVANVVLQQDGPSESIQQGLARFRLFEVPSKATVRAPRRIHVSIGRSEQLKGNIPRNSESKVRFADPRLSKRATPLPANLKRTPPQLKCCWRQTKLLCQHRRRAQSRGAKHSLLRANAALLFSLWFASLRLIPSLRFASLRLIPWNVGNKMALHIRRKVDF